MDNVCGLFANRELAEKGMLELLSAGIPQDQISLVMNNDAKDKFMTVGRDEAGEAAKGATVGAVLVGTLAALVAGGIAVGSLAVPGSTLFVAGPLLAALSGGAAGAVTGGLIGALTQAGVPQAEINRYESEIKRGMALMVVHPETEHQNTLARAVMMDLGMLSTAS